jgi:hypothetical protein
MVNPMIPKCSAVTDSAVAEGEPLPLVPVVNFAELQRGNQATLATVLGVSRSAVGKAIRSGRIPPPGTDGLMDLRRAVQSWVSNTHPGRIRARALRSVNDQLAGLQRRIDRAEAEAATLRDALASEKARGHAVSVGLQDAAAMAVSRLADDLAHACAGLATRHTPARLQAAATSGALSWLIDRAAQRVGLYELAKVDGSNDPSTADPENDAGE